MSNKTKILYVITKANWGGAQRYVFDVATAAARQGYDVTVAYGTKGLLAERLTNEGIRTIEVPALARDVNPLSDWKAYRALVEIFREEKPDIVHLNSSKAGGVGALAAHVAKVPRIIFTAHGWAFNEERPWWQKAPIALLHAVTVLLSDVTICASLAVRNDIEWVPFTLNKLVVIRHGVKEPEFKEKTVARKELLPFVEAEIWIGMVAELHPTKRVEDAVEAFAEIAKTESNTILVIIGEGETRKKLEHLIEAHGLTSRVFLKGFVPDAATYLRAFDLFLFPSRSEALGYALIEAGFAALPVIASNVGGIPELIEDGRTGLLVEPEHPEQLRTRTQTLLTDPVYAKKLGTALEEKTKREFTLSRMTSETLGVYQAP